MKTSTPLRVRLFALALAVTGLLVACGGGGGGYGGGTDMGGTGTGTLRLAMTDAPSCGYDAVNVTVQKVRVHQSSTAADGDAGWSEVVLYTAQRINLLSLTNGVLIELGMTYLPAGRYTQLRLVLADNGGATPMANSVVLSSDHSEVALKTPSGQQSGLKTNIGITVAANQMADFVLDFDACKSVVQAGNSGQYLLKPVVSVIPRFVSGALGYVDAATVAGGTARVSLQQGGVVVKATAPDSTGKFVLQPVAPGSYTLVITANGRATQVITGVVVTTDTVASINTSGAPFTLTASATASATGTAPAGTYVRALQLLTAGPTIEVAGRFVDDVSGAFAFTLPVAAPLVAPYVAAPAPLVFTADTAAAGKYTLAASLTGFAAKQVGLSPLVAGGSVSTTFVFP
ncbi:MAG: DUF4382 domain-containing protein [Betaproteobacteria bacterium]|nr:DUF4382 domain-containing protein [Betaproteobacteria bacterium]